MGAACDRADRKRRAASGVTVQLCEDHAVHTDLIIEASGHIDCILARHGVDHKNGLIHMDRFLDLDKLLHHASSI